VVVVSARVLPVYVPEHGVPRLMRFSHAVTPLSEYQHGAQLGIRLTLL
jgi:hypothetical protein